MWDINLTNEESCVYFKESSVLWRCCSRFALTNAKGSFESGKFSVKITCESGKSFTTGCRLPPKSRNSGTLLSCPPPPPPTSGAARVAPRPEEARRERDHSRPRRGGAALGQTRHQRHLFARPGSSSVAGRRGAALYVASFARVGADDGVWHDDPRSGHGGEMLQDGR